MRNSGILWNNARNILYIKKFNKRKAINLANNKLKTKSFLWQRWIPVATTYAVINDRKQLFSFDFSKLPNKEFVVKPNKWSKWKGIYIVKLIEKDSKLENIKKRYFKKVQEKKVTEQIFEYIKKINREYQIIKNKIIGIEENWDLFYKIWEKEISDWDFKRLLLDNLDGKNSMTIGQDTIIIEEKLRPDNEFKDFCEFGLADIRIIVFNLVPIIAMIRVPTEESWWKANIAAWGIWFWLEITSGKITSMIKNGKRYKRTFPEKYKNYKNKTIPYRNEILESSSKIQYFVNLWYLALDWVITNQWPKLLEINARAWLEVQNISWVKLKKVLDKIKDLKIKYPEKWIEIAKTLFSKSKSSPWSEILYLNQYGTLKILWEEGIQFDNLIVEINLEKKYNYISGWLFKEVENIKDENIILQLFPNNIHLKKLHLRLIDKVDSNKIIIGKNTASQYLIKSIKKVSEPIKIINTEKIIHEEESQLKIIDYKLSQINWFLSLTKYLRPSNYVEQLDKFIEKWGKYSPIFEYNRPEKNKFEKMGEKLKLIKEEMQNSLIKSDIKILFEEKIKELNYKYKLLDAYQKQDFKNIYKYNKSLYWEFNEELLEISKEKIFDHAPQPQDILWKQLWLNEIKEKINEHLYEKWLENIDIIINSNNIARMSIVLSKQPKIKISKNAIFREKEVEAILAHEIDTHLTRYINGTKTGRNIFRTGTWFYLKDEEGLAIYNAMNKLPKDYINLWIYKKYFLLKESQKYSFEKIVDLTKFLYPEKNLERIFKTIIRLKKWIQQTEIVNEWATYMKNKIYLDWYFKIKERIEKWWDTSKLYKWKYRTDDLEFITK